ncbi:hypothetical protein BX666DRAFT_1904194 [Dichotomocladium elegans]|nr:hypothetical protein BX666DRAFT_1904194 [Dichotomocladium elegans]
MAEIHTLSPAAVFLSIPVRHPQPPKMASFNPGFWRIDNRHTRTMILKLYKPHLMSYF